ncbi:MAG TPA: aminotransferase class IV [Chthoniobacter sp.]
MKAWRWNGAAFKRSDTLPITDRGFRYGMAVFESMRVANGEAEFFERHVSRLVQACAEREISVDEAALNAAAGLFQRETAGGFARLYVTAGDGGPAETAEHPRVLVFIEPRTPPDPEDAWEIGLHDESYQPVFNGLKTANYWFNCDALAKARRLGYDETLLFNDRAELVSGCMANVFVLRDDKLCTPPKSSGARTGVIREWVIGRRKVEERRLRREDVVNADEIFLTNSWIGVMPVATVEGRPLGHRSVGPRLAGELARRREE